jgi:hypothetical protein
MENEKASEVARRKAEEEAEKAKKAEEAALKKQNMCPKKNCSIF